MRYPTMRYYPPNYPGGPNQLGTNLDHLLVPELPALVRELTTHLVNETNGGPNWPKFRRFNGKRWIDVFDSLADSVKFVYIVTDELRDFLAEQVALDHMENEKIKVKLLDSANTKLITVSKSSHEVTSIKLQISAYRIHFSTSALLAATEASRHFPFTINHANHSLIPLTRI